MDRYYLTDYAHVLMAGSTGSGTRYGGKSTTMNWWHDKILGHVDVSLYFTPERDSSIRGQEVRSLEGLAKSYRAGKRQFYYRAQSSQMDSDALAKEHKDVIEFLKRVPGSKAVFHDEAQAYSDSSGLMWCLTEGGNIGDDSIKSVVGTQRAWNLPDAMLNCLNVKCWCGPLTSEGEKYFQTMNMSAVAQAISEQMEPYHWAVTDGGELLHINEPVPEGYA